MKPTVAICIPHINTPYFLEGCLNQIEKHSDKYDYQVWVMDQSNPEHKSTVREICQKHICCIMVDIPKVDAGFPLDFALGKILDKFTYFVSLDCDAFPIHDNWLHVPIELINRHNFSFVGHDSGLHLHPDYAKNGNFFHLNNHFRVSKTSVAKKISQEVGFMRPQNNNRVGFTPISHNWQGQADNGVVAQWHADMQNYGPKLSLSLNKIIGMTNEFGVYGMCIDDLVFHFVFGYHPDTIADPQKSLGQNYLNLVKEIATTGLTEPKVQQLLQMLQPHHPYTARTIFGKGETMQLKEDNVLFKQIDKLKQEI